MKPIPFAKPYVGAAEIRQVSRAIRSGWLTTGCLTAELEARFQERVGVRHALTVNSATAGLHLALEAVGVRAGDKVITTPFTFTATAEVIRYLGAEPLFADILPDSPLIDPQQIRRLATQPGVKAIIPVHFGGEACNLREINQICLENDLVCIEDAAHAFPARVDGNYVGTGGTIGVYSFYATKTLTTGEGGMVVTNRDDLAQRIRIMRLHGIDREVWSRYTSRKPQWEYDVVAPGYKYNLTDIASAIGLAQLQKADAMNQKRRRIAQAYTQALSDLRQITLPRWNDAHSWHLFTVQIEPRSTDAETLRCRNNWIEALAARGIGTSVHYKPLHLMSYYREHCRFQPDDFPNSTHRYVRTFSLPIYPGMTKAQIGYIIKTVRELDRHAL